MRCGDLDDGFEGEVGVGCNYIEHINKEEKDEG